MVPSLSWRNVAQRLDRRPDEAADHFRVFLDEFVRCGQRAPRILHFIADEKHLVHTLVERYIALLRR